MNYGKMVIKSVFVFGAVLGITFSANAMEPKKSKGFNKKLVAFKENQEPRNNKQNSEAIAKANEKKRLKKEEEEKAVNARLEQLKRTFDEVDKTKLATETVKKRKVAFEQNEDGYDFAKALFGTSSKNKVTPMPATPMPTPGNKKRKSGLPINELLNLNDYFYAGNVDGIKKILSHEDNRKMLSHFNGFNYPKTNAGNYYLSTARMKQHNNNNNNNNS